MTLLSSPSRLLLFEQGNSDGTDEFIEFVIELILSLLVRMLCLVPERLTQSHCTYIAIVWGLRFAFFLNILIMFYALKSLCQPSTVSHTSSLQFRPMLNCVRVFSQYILRQMDLNLNIDFLLTEHIRSLDIESTVSF
jgi:hypothetical protein